MGKMKAVSAYSDQVARMNYNELGFVTEGRVPRKAVENVRTFVISYGLVSEEKMPPVDQLYTDQFFK